LSEGARAGLMALLVAVVFVGPTAYGIYELANAYAAGSNYLAQSSAQGAGVAPSFFSYLPFGAKMSAFWLENISNSSGVVDVLNKLSNGKLLSFVPLLWSQAMDKILAMTVMLVSLFFMLKHGKSVQSRYAGVLAYWVEERSVRYVDSAIEALRGTINGVVLVGAFEGVLLALPLVLGGVQAGLLIGLAAGLLGVIPMLLVLPCLAYLYLSGQTTWAIVGAIDLALVWFVFENIVKPQVIGKRVRLNSLLILMAMVGGLQTLGLVGLFLGPAFVAVAMELARDLFWTQGGDAS
jgi:predicted PurR-regulated permease PerM